MVAWVPPHQSLSKKIPPQAFPPANMIEVFSQMRLPPPGKKNYHYSPLLIIPMMPTKESLHVSLCLHSCLFPNSAHEALVPPSGGGPVESTVSWHFGGMPEGGPQPCCLQRLQFPVTQL